MYVCLVVANRVISSVLLREDEEKAQRPIYCMNKALIGAELRYSRLEKTGFALFVMAKKLSTYFQDHHIHVLTHHPIGLVLQNPTSLGRLIKWVMMLMQFSIKYMLRTAIKGQALTNFIVECTAQDPKPCKLSQLEEPWWELATDGASRRKGCKGGAVLTSLEELKLYHVFVFTFNPTNNEAEYEALVVGIRLAKRLEAERLRIGLDLRLVVR